MTSHQFPQPPVIAALHLPAFPASGHPDARPLAEIRDFALRNVDKAVNAGVRGVYLQDLGDYPVPRSIAPYTVAGMAVIGAALRSAFPELTLGVCLMAHGAREPLAVAEAIGAQFVRLKVYVGAMVKAEGLLEGCAADAVRYRRQIGAEQIAIFADVYDRTGEPLGRMSLGEESRQAAVFGRADALVLTGKNYRESLEMVREVRLQQPTIPLWIGGGVDASNVGEALSLASGVIVGSAFKTLSGFTRESMGADWDAGRLHEFMQNANRQCYTEM